MRTRDGIRTGCITDNSQLRGLCERVCVEVKRVFDGVVSFVDREVFTTQLVDFSIAPTPPLTFVQAHSLGQYTPVSNLKIIPIGDNGKSRVIFDVCIPTTVDFEDANGNKGTARTFITDSYDLIMRVPNSGLIPFQVECNANLEAAKGRIVGTENAVLTCCIVAITRIVANQDMIIPTYGLVEYDQVESSSPCQLFFDTPIFSQPVNRINNRQ